MEAVSSLQQEFKRKPKSGFHSRVHFLEFKIGDFLDQLVFKQTIVGPLKANRRQRKKEDAADMLQTYYYGGHFIEASIGMVFQVRFWEHGKVAMGSCSLLPSQLW